MGIKKLDFIDNILFPLDVIKLDEEQVENLRERYENLPLNLKRRIEHEAVSTYDEFPSKMEGKWHFAMIYETVLVLHSLKKQQSKYQPQEASTT